MSILAAELKKRVAVKNNTGWGVNAQPWQRQQCRKTLMNNKKKKSPCAFFTWGRERDRDRFRAVDHRRQWCCFSAEANEASGATSRAASPLCMLRLSGMFFSSPFLFLITIPRERKWPHNNPKYQHTHTRTHIHNRTTRTQSNPVCITV